MKISIFKILITLLLFLLPISSLVGQQKFDFEHISTDKGLITNWMIFCPMINDAQGFLWIGSDHGAHKYDGYYFTIYKYIQNDSTSLLNESIMDLFKDSKGNLWLATKIGFNKWILETESFERYYLDSNNTGKTDINFVNDINEDNKSKLWICSQGSGLTVFNLQSKEMMHYKFDAFDSNSISNDTTLFTYMADDNQLFKGSR